MNVNDITKGGKDYIGYEYKSVITDSNKVSMFLDGYQNFGWRSDDSSYTKQTGGQVKLKLKRDRKILNKAELTRLQKHFEACIDEIETLEKSKTSLASIVALTIGIIGTAFMAGSTFAITHEPPLVALCIILAIPAFIGWGLPIFFYKAYVRKKTAAITPIIEQQYDEIYEICKKGNALLGNSDD